ncbi:putative disease resistance protein [Gossypium australe]|uniref:Putative disease resistance protein n=1 Tax=Gossypium australe TaxID=47621 RepID=A0A5B6VTW2_9ROSI|nr:putative disease resistance protein [Gossypium australe]
MEFALNKIDNYLDNNRSINQLMNDLKRKVMELNGMKEDTDSRMSVELLPRKKPKREVQIWLENVERINGEVQSLNERIGESSTLTRGFRADNVLKRTRVVEELIQQGKFEEGLVVDNPQWIGQVLSTTRLSGKGTKACMEEIWKCLMDDEVGKIGVWGWVVRRVLLSYRRTFDIVIWITASKETSIAKLQKDIASQIKVTFCGDDCETRRAGMLFETLSWKSRFVVILADIWEEVSFEKVGIPEPSTRSKLVLTTRSLDVRFSYDSLKDPKLQHCFLSCTLYPEDWGIKERELVRLWIAEELVEEMDSWQAEFDRGRAIMNRLLNNCLLEVFSETEDERCVKMHDLVRDMALHITSAKPRFFVKAGMGLWEPPNVQEWSENLEKVSLMRNWELEVLYPLEMSPPKCPILTTLLLCRCGIKSIPEGFFSHMDGLKVLDVSANFIESLPNSISNLKNLTALLLANCFRLRYVPSLSNLRALKELDLGGTDIKEVPHGMQNLSSLKCLNLNCRISNVHEIPNGIFPRPSCLQELNVGQALISGKEVGELKKLETFEGAFYDFHNLNAYVQAFHGREEPRQYFIFVGEIFMEWAVKKSASKKIELQLEVSSCDQLEEIIASEGRGRVTMEFCIPRLKEMTLTYLPELKSICSVDAVMICESLERLKVISCPKLKRMPIKLPQVEPSSPLAITLEVKELCESIEWADPDFKFNLIRKL